MPATLTPINPSTLPAPVGYSQVIEARGTTRTIYIAGQVSVDAKGELVGKGNFEAQAAQVFANLSAALAAAGCSARDLVKMTVFVRDMSNLVAYRSARQRFFGSVTPAAAPAVTLVEVSKLYSEDILLEIEAIAAA